MLSYFGGFRRSCAAPARYDRSTDELGGRSSVPRRRNRASALAWKERCTFSEPELSNKRCQRSVFVIGARGWKYRRRGGALLLSRRPPRACGRMDEARGAAAAGARAALRGPQYFLEGCRRQRAPCAGVNLFGTGVLYIFGARGSRGTGRGRGPACAPVVYQLANWRRFAGLIDGRSSCDTSAGVDVFVVTPRELD